MAHSVSGIAFKFNDHAKALGLPLVFDCEVKETTPEQKDIWTKIVDPVTGGESSTLVATWHQPKGGSLTIRPYPFDPPRHGPSAQGRAGAPSGARRDRPRRGESPPARSRTR